MYQCGDAEEEYVPFPKTNINNNSNFNRDDRFTYEREEQTPAGKPTSTGKVPTPSKPTPAHLKDRKVPDIEMYDGTPKELQGFLDKLDIYFEMKPSSYSIDDHKGKIMYVSMRCTGAALNWFTAMKETKWMSYGHWVEAFKRNFANPHAKDDARRSMKQAIQKDNQKVADFIAYMRKLQLDADLDASLLWSYLWGAIPSSVREYLARTQGYTT